MQKQECQGIWGFTKTMILMSGFFHNEIDYGAKRGVAHFFGR